MKFRVKDPVSCITHLIGAILAITGMVLLLSRTDATVNPKHFASFSIFGFSMILLYSSSAAYHGFYVSPHVQQWLRRIDHIMIFMLIAGTYTPICLIPLYGIWGWSILATIWALALLGGLFKIFFLNAPRKLYTAIYLLMGWIIMIALYPLLKSISIEAFLWLLVGGVFYSTGALIYAIKKPNPWPKVFGFHEIFHIFIILGTACHFWMIYNFL
jgi:hemolysin III